MARPWLGPCVDTTVYGCRVRLYLEGNICEKSALFAPHTFDTAERDALASTGQPGAVFVDVGANVGLYSLSLAKAWSEHERTRVLAVEPHPAVRDRLEFNLQQNPHLPIDVSDVAITASEGPTGLRTDEKNLGQTHLSEGGDISVQGVPLLTELNRRGISRLDALKVDVEGAEGQVLVPFLQTAPEELLPEVLVVENNLDQWTQDVIGWIERRGLALQEETRMNLIFKRRGTTDGGGSGAGRE
jgi:FkbM family methyltransferase